MKNTLKAILAILIIFLSSCNQDNKKEAVNESDKELADLSKTYFSPLPLIAKDESNLKTQQKIDLGHKLYFDTKLSKDQTISCNSCHNLATYGVDNEATSLGDDGGRGDRNSPTVLNAALHSTQFWDGRAADVEEQAGMPILNPVEMAIPNENYLIDRLKQDPEYLKLFAQAFPDQTDPLTYQNLMSAIALFERELLTPAPFDSYLKGDMNALTEEQKLGLNTFIEAGCITCHSGPLLGGNMFQKFGVYGDYWEYTKAENIDQGRFKVTGIEVDKYFFKVPSLRNVSETYPYLHDGSIADTKEVIRIMGKIQLNKDLSDQEVNQVDAFLKSLSSTEGVKMEYQTAPI